MLSGNSRHPDSRRIRRADTDWHAPGSAAILPALATPPAPPVHRRHDGPAARPCRHSAPRHARALDTAAVPGRRGRDCVPCSRPAASAGCSRSVAHAAARERGAWRWPGSNPGTWKWSSRPSWASSRWRRCARRCSCSMITWKMDRGPLLGGSRGPRAGVVTGVREAVWARPVAIAVAGT